MNHKFIHLRVQSSYSLLESTLSVTKIAELARKYSTPAVALTDSNNLFGSLEFAIATAKRGIQPIHGIISNIKYYAEYNKVQYGEILLLAKDEIGYKNLLKLASFPYIKNDRSTTNHITLEDLFTHSQGIIVLSGYFYGIIGQLLFNKCPSLAEKYTYKFKEVFGNRFYFEIHRINNKQIFSIEANYIQLANKIGIPLVATNNVLFEAPESYSTHEVLMKICNNGSNCESYKINNQCYFKSPEEMLEIFSDLPDAIANTVHIARRTSFMLTVQPPSLPKFAKTADEENNLITKLSTEGLLQKLTSKFDYNNTPELERQNIRKIYLERLHYELNIICKMQFSGYFLIVSDFIKWSKKRNISVSPRGSGAASIVAWSLSITDVDPIKFGLLFERFLNPERVSMPDFDIDFCQERRMEVINYVRSKYGENRVGQIITFGKLQAKAVIKDVAKVLGLGYYYANYITSLVPFNAITPVTLKEAIDKVTELYTAYQGQGLYNLKSLVDMDSRYLKLAEKWQKQNYVNIERLIKQATNQNSQHIDEELHNWKNKYNYEKIIHSDVTYNELVSKCQKLNLTAIVEEVNQIRDEYNNLVNNRKAQIQTVIRTAIELEGIHRHVSIHAAGIVISDQDLINIIALYKDKNSEIPVAQYSMKYLELAGLVKFDFLGLQTLTVVAKCLELLKAKNIDLKIHELEFTDSTTYKLLSSGETVGVFQFESIGMQDTLKRLQPDCVEDLIALGALYRPGPMDNIPTYIACKHGKQQPNYLHPKLEPILKETYGVIIYQEQVMEIAKTLAKYTLGGADLLRRAMGKKIKSEMEDQKLIFIQGAMENGIDNEQAENIFTEVAKFAGYGFNKSHAAIYAVISYQTAYLKANYPAEFLIVCLNLDINDQDKINLFIHEAKKIGIKINPPNINESREYFSISTDGSIIFALGALKGVTPNIGRLITEERDKNGQFKTIMDFAERMLNSAINRKSFESLIHAGCFDNLQHTTNRRQLFMSIDQLINHAVSKHHERKVHQFSFMSCTLEDIIVQVPEYSLTEKSLKEFEALGTFLTCHPLTQYEPFLAKHGITNSQYLKTDLAFGNRTIKIAGVIHKKSARMSSKGKFNTIKFSDIYGNFEVSIFNEEIFRKHGELIEVGNLVIAQCEIFKDEIGMRITAKAFEDIKSLEKHLNRNIKLTVNNKEQLLQLIKVVSNISLETDFNAQDTTKIEIMVPFMHNKFYAIVVINLQYPLTLSQVTLLNELCHTITI